MATHWVKALQIVRRSEHGRLITQFPGDVFAVKNMELALLLAEGKVAPLHAGAVRSAFDLSECGIVTTANHESAAAYVAAALDLPISPGDTMLYPRTLLWNGSKTLLKLHLLPIGFHRLERWDVAAPLWAYRQLARDIGTEDDRRKTEAVIHDLRVPVYETGLLYLRRNATTEALLAAWYEELPDSDPRLAFMRAVYRVKPVLCALPQTWIRGA